MGEVVTPLSPVDPVSSHAYFALKGREAEGKSLQKNLKSSIGQNEVPDTPSSATLERPKSPKSRNASRTRQPEQQKAPLHNLASDEEVSQIDLGVRLPLRSAATADDQYTPPRPKSAVW